MKTPTFNQIVTDETGAYTVVCNECLNEYGLAPSNNSAIGLCEVCDCLHEAEYVVEVKTMRNKQMNTIKVGTRVECIAPTGNYSLITVGEVYECIKVEVIDDAEYHYFTHNWYPDGGIDHEGYEFEGLILLPCELEQSFKILEVKNNA